MYARIKENFEIIFCLCMHIKRIEMIKINFNNSRQSSNIFKFQNINFKWYRYLRISLLIIDTNCLRYVSAMYNCVDCMECRYREQLHTRTHTHTQSLITGRKNLRLANLTSLDLAKALKVYSQRCALNLYANSIIIYRSSSVGHIYGHEGQS